jgi:hypothetical protein
MHVSMNIKKINKSPLKMEENNGYALLFQENLRTDARKGRFCKKW